MKNFLLAAFILFSTLSPAQLNQRFYSSGNNPFIAQDLGAEVSYTFVSWRDIQQNMSSTFNWSLLDTRIQNAQTLGLRTMIVINCTSPLTSQDSIPGTCAYDSHLNPTSDNGSSWMPVGSDTAQWKIFVQALVDRYDGDTTNDMNGLIYPVKEWKVVGQEWQRVWCSSYNDTLLANAQQFVQLVNMTYRVIKTQQPSSVICFAGIDPRGAKESFSENYFNQPTLCLSQNCTSTQNVTPPQIIMIPGFQSNRRNVQYIFNNAMYDEVDVHMYGYWNDIPGVVAWLRDSAQGKPVVFMEGGGPYCPACENIYHNSSDTDGRLPTLLVRDNASYVVYYFITGFANGVSEMHWNHGPEYSGWGATFGDLDLLSINSVRKPSYYVYRWLAKDLFSNSSADTVENIPESDPQLYHYIINPLGMNVAWSTNPTDSIVITGPGQLYRWDIPLACDSLYPTYCDSLVQQSSIAVGSSYTIYLNNDVPVFYSWNNVLSSSQNIADADSYSVKIYPDPFSETATLKINGPEIRGAEVKLYNDLGQNVKTINAGTIGLGQTITLQRDNLPDGFYFIQLVQDNKILAVEKLMIAE
ncbi:MAG: T9SS type A sorting domain-containing protein [Bacteroidetes bacterium]|nr:T9SS type A sorting domain-containing protein [Bacteroidota bacterium]